MNGRDFCIKDFLARAPSARTGSKINPVSRPLTFWKRGRDRNAPIFGVEFRRVPGFRDALAANFSEQLVRRECF